MSQVRLEDNIRDHPATSALCRPGLQGGRAVLTALLLVGVCLVAAPSSTRAATPPAPSSPAAVVPLVRIPFPREDGSLTPYTFETGYALVSLIYDTLMLRDEKGVPQPWLARSVAASPDFRTFTLRLRDGARWQDDVALTAADVAFTFAYVATHPNPRFTPEVRLVEHVQARDPATVVVTLRQPSPGFADQTLADLPILPAHLWRSLGPGQIAPAGLPVGSGPYRLTEHIPGRLYRFDATPGYFLGPPRVQTIMMPIITDAETTLTAFEDHTVDMVPVSLRADDVTRLNVLGDRVVNGPDYLGTVLMFNARRAPFDRPEVRQAVSRAIDPAMVAQGIGNAVAADRGYVDPRSPWAAPKDPHVLDQRGARVVLSALRLPPLDLLFPDNDGARMAAAHQVVIALREAGLTVDAKPVSPQVLATAVGEDGSAVDFTMAIWSAYPLASYDPDFLSRVFGSGPAAMFNYAGYHDPAFDALAGRVAITPDPAARHAAVDQELQLLADDAPIVPLYYPIGSFAFRPSVYDGWVYVKGTGILTKRSFAGPLLQLVAPAPGAGPTPAPGAGGGFPMLPLALGAIGLILIGLAGAGVELVRGRR